MFYSFYEEFQPAAYYPGNDSEDKDNFYPRELEVAFCRNFSCCGLLLSDLHVLLQHYEEYHVRFEEDDSQASFYDDDWSSNDGSAPNSPQLPTKQIHNQQYTINAMLKKKVMPSRSDLYPEEIGISHNDSSAFDTSILRSSQSQNVKSSKKRNHSQFTATTLDMMTPNAKKMALPAHMGMTTSTFPDLTMSAMSDEEFMAQTGAMFMPSSNNGTQSLFPPWSFSKPVFNCLANPLDFFPSQRLPSPLTSRTSVQFPVATRPTRIPMASSITINMVIAILSPLSRVISRQ